MIDIFSAHQTISDAGLTPWTSGGVSFRYEPDFMQIKPSGLSCKNLERVCYVRISDCRYDIALKPSTDTPSHAFLYCNLPGINAIVHTHSRAATAWSTRRIPIPCILTEMADVFGGEIPCAPYSEIGTEALGRAAYEVLKGSPANAVLLSNHGVLTVGKTLEEAVRNAIMVEHAASIALDLIYAPAVELASEEIKACFERYSQSYGQ